jgi:hypothetical protein
MTHDTRAEAGGGWYEADAEWIVIRGRLWGHNNSPCGQPTPGWPIGSQGVFGVLSNY